LADLATRLASDLTGTLADGQLSANVPLLNAANLFTATQTVTKAGIAAVSTDGVVARNSTLSTGGATVQISQRTGWMAVGVRGRRGLAQALGPAHHMEIGNGGLEPHAITIGSCASVFDLSDSVTWLDGST